MTIAHITKNFCKLIMSALISCSFAFEASAAKEKDICAKHEAEIKNDQEYRVVFGDSGVGGLIFALDVAQALEPRLRALEEQYAVTFTFSHFGDSKNAPYGSKKPREIRKLTAQFMEYLLGLPNTHSAVISCSTASAVYDKKMHKHFSEKYRDIKIITIIEDSSAELVKVARQNNDGQSPYIALMATPATIKSGAYQNKIAELTKGENVKLYSYAPQNWVRNIESGADKNFSQAEVNSDLEAFKSLIGSNFNKVTTLGLFCTHYPLYKNQIQDFFNKNSAHKVEILTQGHIFAEKIYEDIANNLENAKFAYQKRQKPLPAQCAKNIALNSELSGDNIEQTKDVITHTHPNFVDRVLFKKVLIKN